MKFHIWRISPVAGASRYARAKFTHFDDFFGFQVEPEKQQQCPPGKTTPGCSLKPGMSLRFQVAG